jgi:hypothetical protein
MYSNGRLWCCERCVRVTASVCMKDPEKDLEAARLGSSFSLGMSVDHLEKGANAWCQ